MTVSTIVIAVLTAFAAVFAVLFYLNKDNAKILHSRVSGLNDELTELRVEKARLEAREGGICTPVNSKTVGEYLKKEKTSEVETLEDCEAVCFGMNDQKYFIDCRRSPRFLMVGIRHDIEGATNIHDDIMERAANYVTNSVHMVKMTVAENDYFGCHIVSTDRTIATLRENFDIYMSILNDAEAAFRDKYWEIMAVEHPDECKEEDAGAGDNETEASNMEDLAMKIATSSPDNKKIQS